MHTDTPLVTIGIPFHNPGSLLADSIGSVLAQSYSNWELLLVNDGSTDGSSRIAATYADKDPRIRFINEGNCQGLAARLNQIAVLARGQLLARMDADDMMHPSRIVRQVTAMQEMTSCDLVHTGMVYLNNERRPVGVSGVDATATLTPYEFLKSGGIAHPTVMTRRVWSLKNPYSVEYNRAEDRELFARTIGRSQFLHMPEPLYFYYLVGNIRLKAWQQSYRTVQKILLQYGPDLIGSRATVFLWLKETAKLGVLPLLLSLGGESALARRRYRALKRLEKEWVEDALLTINKML
jgi:glycosyltransferase involved in cell wall biosynthesis